MRSRIGASLVMMAFTATSTAYAHGGGLDRNGCHTNRKTGDYHCHGAPAKPTPPPIASRAEPRAAATTATEPTKPQPLFAVAEQAKPENCGASFLEAFVAARTLLIALGFLDPERDGTSDRATAEAVKRFEADTGVTPVGVVNGQLLERLASEVARRATGKSHW
jgi:hypothetical protein